MSFSPQFEQHQAMLAIGISVRGNKLHTTLQIPQESVKNTFFLRRADKRKNVDFARLLLTTCWSSYLSLNSMCTPDHISESLGDYHQIGTFKIRNNHFGHTIANHDPRSPFHAFKSMLILPSYKFKGLH